MNISIQDAEYIFVDDSLPIGAIAFNLNWALVTKVEEAMTIAKL